MENRSLFKNISPLDHRYYYANKELFEDLSAYLSEDASVAYCVKAEMALLKTHIQLQKLGGPSLEARLDRMEGEITSEEVYQEEEKTRHNIRALVNVISRRVDEELKPWVHMGATSVDILDTAASMRMRDVSRKVILPLLIKLEGEVIRLAEQEAETPQVGRTHGQHAVPLTLGFALAEYVSRLGQSIRELERLSRDLRGKLSGAVGGYNAASMITPDPMEMERMYLDYLGLKPSEYSTQMVEPEYMLRLLLEYNTAFGIIANLADDLRHLQRSELDEVREFFSSDQVGSSTMPQKRNPWNCEHVKSLWKAFAPRVMSFYMDQISEHQRDLSNSASARFQADFIAGFAAAAERMRRILAGLAVNREQLRKNLSVQGDFVLAEPTYILLAMAGVKDAHETVRLITLSCEKQKKSIKEILEAEHPETWEKIKVQLKKVSGLEAVDFYTDSSLYRGKTAEKTKGLCSKYKQEMSFLQNKLS